MLLFLALLASSLFADPFGLKMGMTLDEIQEKCGGKEPVYLGEGCRYGIEPIKKSTNFIRYDVYVHDDLGLFQILAYTEPSLMQTCEMKLELLSAMFEPYYGIPSKDEDGCYWNVDNRKALKKEKLVDVVLMIVPADKEGEGQVVLMYAFENYKEAQATAGGPF